MRGFLSQKGVAFQERDFFKQPFSRQELRQLLDARSPAEVFSLKSPSVKALGLEGKALTEGEMLDLMLQEPRLLRRPLVHVGDRLIIGVHLRELEEALG